MPGHIRRRGKRSWQVVVSAGFDPRTGKRVQVWRTVKGTRKDAEAALARLLAEVQSGGAPVDSSATVKDFLLGSLDRYTGLAGRTRERYSELLRLHVIPRIGHLRLHQLRPVHLEDLYRTLQQPKDQEGAGLSGTTVLQVHRVLHRAFAVGMRWGVLSRNPADHVQAPKRSTQEIRPPDPETVRRLLEALQGTRLHTPVALVAITGLRRGELLALRWGDVDLESGAMAVVRSLEQTLAGLAFKDLKNPRSRRRLPLPPAAVALLRAHRKAQAEERLQAGPAWADHDLVFPGPWGTRGLPSRSPRASARPWPGRASGSGFTTCATWWPVPCWSGARTCGPPQGSWGTRTPPPPCGSTATRS
jgi:integrase